MENRQITVDCGKASSTGKILSHKLCVGGGRAYETLVAENQRHLRMAREKCGFQYLRFHGLLHDDMGVYTVLKNGEEYFNFQYIDLLYDYILSIGMKPFVELSFMPKALASGEETVFFWKGNITMPKDMNKWRTLIEKLVRHLTERYGADEIRTWPFEVWNEPNLNMFFASEQQFEDYMKLYEATARTIKAVDPAYQVGGPATAEYAWVPEFIARCVEKDIPVDFITTHTYGVTGAVDEFGENTQTLIPKEDSVSEEIKIVARQIKESGKPNLPLHFTEWNSSFSPRDNIHDSYHQASFILTRIRDSMEYCASMSYWTFSDIFEEAGPGHKPFHGNFGLINISGIRKPSFFAYQYLNMLGSLNLACDDRHALASKSDRGVNVLFWDYTVPDQNGQTDQEYYVRDLPPAVADTAQITITGLAPGRYTVNLRGVGYRINDAYTAYLDLKAGKEDPHLSPAEVSCLNDLCSGLPIGTEIADIGEDGTYTFKRPMRQNDVFLLSLEKLS